MKAERRYFPRRTGWRVRGALGRIGLLGVLVPRRFLVFGCGAGKSGTQSICSIFENYRHGHEPDREGSLALTIRYLKKDLSDSEFDRQLIRRDQRHWLEMDASDLNGCIAIPLARTFPNAKFILTVRDVFAWTNSNLNHWVDKGVSNAWKEAHRLSWGLDRFEHTRFDEPLRSRDLLPLAAYFARWQAHNKHVIESVPEDRLLIVTTKELSTRLADIARFVGVPAETLAVQESWTNKAARDHRLLDQLDQSYVRDMAEQHCREMMDRLFPGAMEARFRKTEEAEALSQASG